MTTERLAGHGGNAGLCLDDHTCPPCENGTGPCLDLFEHPICGTVACTADEPPAEPELELTTEWGIRVDYPGAPHLEGFTSPVPSEAAADRKVAADRPGIRVTKVRRQVTAWEDA